MKIPARASALLEPPVIVQFPLVLQTMLPPTLETMYAEEPVALKPPCKVRVVSGVFVPMRIAFPTIALFLVMIWAEVAVFVPPVRERGPLPSMVRRPPLVEISAKAPDPLPAVRVRLVI